MKLQLIVQKVSMGLAVTLVSVALCREIMIINERSAAYEDNDASEVQLTMPPLTPSQAQVVTPVPKN